LAGALLDAIHSATAVVDGAGVIRAVNAAWDRFSAINGGDSREAGVGANYLAVCARAAEQGCITRRRQRELELTDAARRDPLTGLLNRAAIESDAAPALTALFIDLDNFKSVNDGLGHAAGDEVLARAANRIVHQTRTTDRVARVGGDEFIVILGELNADETADAIAHRIEESLSAPYEVGSDVVRVGASIGLARGEAGEGLSDVVQRADKAMYAVKASHHEVVIPDGDQARRGDTVTTG
jgi:diguanylate cyclase (GGDEF)-like protein